MGLLSKILGTISNSFTIGDGTTADKYLYADNGDANLPGFRRLNSSGVWEYSNDGTTWNPMTGGSGSSVLVQTRSAQITSDTTTTSTTFVDLLTVNITTGANPVILRAQAHASNSSANINGAFRITVDGVSRGGGQWRSPAAAGIACAACCLQFKTGALTAAAHVVKLQWLVASNTGRIRPVAAADLETATLLVEEVTN